MIQKQAGIEVVMEIDQHFDTPFVDDETFRGMAQPLVLISPTLSLAPLHAMLCDAGMSITTRVASINSSSRRAAFSAAISLGGAYSATCI